MWGLWVAPRAGEGGGQVPPGWVLPSLWEDETASGLVQPLQGPVHARPQDQAQGLPRGQATAGERQGLRELLPAAGEDPEGTLRGMRRHPGGDAP